MHKYYRAIGFSDVTSRDQANQLIKKTINDADVKTFMTYENDIILAEYRKEYAPGMGICVCGEMDELREEFLFEYSFPYFIGEHTSTREKSVIERHIDKYAFAGLCEDNRIGISIIYYLQNRMDFVQRNTTPGNVKVNVPISFSGLSVEGTIMMPINKSEKEKATSRINAKKRKILMEAAKNGDEEAIESLSLEEMDTYTTITNKIKKSDIFTIVDTYFMPYGVECDLYSCLGVITDCELFTNSITGEEVWRLELDVNEMPIDICINKKDLFGEPEVGRRFKGVIWLQGALEYMLS